MGDAFHGRGRAGKMEFRRLVSSSVRAGAGLLCLRISSFCTLLARNEHIARIRLSTVPYDPMLDLLHS